MTARCRDCLSHKVRLFETLHHYCCAYVGPDYDYGEERVCPKCREALGEEYQSFEIVGHSFRCDDCGAEFLDAGAAASEGHAGTTPPEVAGE